MGGRKVPLVGASLAPRAGVRAWRATYAMAPASHMEPGRQGGVDGHRGWTVLSCHTGRRSALRVFVIPLGDHETDPALALMSGLWRLETTIPPPGGCASYPAVSR